MNLHTMALLPSGPYMLLAFQTGMRVRAFTKTVWKNDGNSYYTAEITAYILELNHSIEVLTAGSHNYTSTVTAQLEAAKDDLTKASQKLQRAQEEANLCAEKLQEAQVKICNIKALPTALGQSCAACGFGFKMVYRFKLCWIKEWFKWL